MVRALTLAAALLVVAPLGGGPRAQAETIADALKRQEALSRLVEQWIRLAARDPREDKLDEYVKYQDEDWKKPKRNVKAEDLAEIVADPTADKGLRQRAAKALEDAAIATRDPDLAPDKRNDTSKRKRWAKQHLLPLISKADEKGGDQLGRGLAFNLLKGWFPPPSRDASDVSNYDPASAHEDTWAPTQKVFRDVLNR